MNIKETLQQIDDRYQQISQYRNSLTNNVSEADKQISNLYHEVEANTYNFISAYKMILKLQEKLRLRRRFKVELTKAEATFFQLSGLDLKIKKAISRIEKVDDKFILPEGRKLRII